MQAEFTEQVEFTEQAELTGAGPSIKPTWREYIELTKPAMVAVLLLSALASMFIAAAGLPDMQVVIAAVIGISLSAAGACALNSYYEKDLDALMIRTRTRPLPTERMLPFQAFRFGVGLIVLSFFVLLVGTNWIAAGLNLLGVFLYIVVYTRWLKRRTIHSTIVGAIAGAFPTLVGWAAVAGGLSVEVLILFAIVMYWSPAHSFSLALIHRNEYVKAALPVVPVIQGPNAARMQIGRYSVLVVVLTLLPVGFGLLDKYYAFAAIPLGMFLVYHAIQLHVSPNTQNALKYYKHSMLYLTLLLAAMLADRAIL